MMTSIRLQNFKAHRDTTVPLGRFTVLVGPNGAGKTSVLEALRALSELRSRRLMEYFSGARNRKLDDMLRRGAKEPIEIEVAGRAGSVGWTLKVTMARVASHEIDEEPWSSSVQSTYGTEKSNVMTDDPLRSTVPSGVLQSLGRGVLYRFTARRIARASYSDAKIVSVKYDGSNTAVTLASYKLENEDVFGRIEDTLRRIVPSVERVRLRREMVGDRMGSKIYIDYRGAPDVPAHAASEGTLMTLALLTVLYSPRRPNLVLLDDIDNSLHPAAQIELVSQLKRLLKELPETQIVATTHSPYILDELDPRDVQVFALREDGSVATKRLSEHPEAARMKGALTVGQIWSSDHERDWVLTESA
jgi:predicted ATPase